MQHVLKDDVSDLPSKGDAAIAFRNCYSITVDGLKKTKSRHLVIKEVKQASLVIS